MFLEIESARQAAAMLDELNGEEVKTELIHSGQTGLLLFLKGVVVIFIHLSDCPIL